MCDCKFYFAIALVGLVLIPHREGMTKMKFQNLLAILALLFVLIPHREGMTPSRFMTVVASFFRPIKWVLIPHREGMTEYHTLADGFVSTPDNLF